MAVHDAQYESCQRLTIDRDIWRRAEDSPDRVFGSHRHGIVPVQVTADHRAVP
jgi:hypothetical protein